MDNVPNNNNTFGVIIAAIISALAVLLAARFEDIVDLIRGKARKIGGEWDGNSFWIIYKPDQPFIPERDQKQDRFVDKYTVRIKQTGRRVKAVMTETEVPQGMQKTSFAWTGKVIGDYLMYQCRCENANRFMISCAMLYIHAGGDKMSGYFIANGGATTASRTWVGYAELSRRE
ncbi:MAG: hypothetical protein NTY65_01125 [Planctomycetota bacterium]|nr:hypothetical protein [Planctomycetota bacterium]